MVQPLMKFVERGDYDGFQRVLLNNPFIDEEEKEETLWFSVKTQLPAFCRILLDAKCDPNICLSGETPLQYVARHVETEASAQIESDLRSFGGHTGICVASPLGQSAHDFPRRKTCTLPSRFRDQSPLRRPWTPISSGVKYSPWERATSGRHYRLAVTNSARKRSARLEDYSTCNAPHPSRGTDTTYGQRPLGSLDLSEVSGSDTLKMRRTGKLRLAAERKHERGSCIPSCKSLNCTRAREDMTNEVTRLRAATHVPDFLEVGLREERALERDLREVRQRNLEMARIAANQAPKDECVVCRDSERAILFLPCSHLCTCQKCATCLRDCPLCREAILQKLFVYK